MPPLLRRQLEMRQLKYKKKARRIQKMIKNMVFENSALCDKVAQMQETILCVKEERRFLLTKLIERDTDILLLDAKPPTHIESNNALDGLAASTSNPPIRTRKPYKKRDPNSIKSKKETKTRKCSKAATQPTSHASGNQQQQSESTNVQTIAVDEQGCPILPIQIGDSLTVHELGEIVADRCGYHNESWLYPVGFVSTRIYGHMLDPRRKCVYTCKITDGGDFPIFEIIPDSDMEYAIAGPSADLCHAALLQTMNSHSNGRHVEVCPQGEWFFGLGHAVVMTILQSSPSVSQCFNFAGFTMDAQSAAAASGNDKLNDATLNYEALQKYLVSASDYHTVPEVKEEPPDELFEQSADASPFAGMA